MNALVPIRALQLLRRLGDCSHPAEALGHDPMTALFECGMCGIQVAGSTVTRALGVPDGR